MRNNQSIEIALKIEHPDQLTNIDLSQSGYIVDNDFTNYYNSIYRRSVLEFIIYPVQRIYYGTEFCELRIPSCNELEFMFEQIQNLGLNITFLTPPVTNYGIERIKKIIPLLKKYRCEVSVNDYGVLELLQSQSFEGNVISGRILDKSYHDGRMNSYMLSSYTNENGNTYLRSPAVAAKQYQALLLKHGIQRYDIDVPLYGVDLSSKLESTHFSAYLPYGYVTTGRNCMMRNVGIDDYGGFDLTNSICARKCKYYDQLMEQPISGIQLNPDGSRRRSIHMMRKGNTIFYATNLLDDEKHQFDRIIIQRTLML